MMDIAGGMGKVNITLLSVTFGKILSLCLKEQNHHNGPLVARDVKVDQELIPGYQEVWKVFPQELDCCQIGVMICYVINLH